MKLSTRICAIMCSILLLMSMTGLCVSADSPALNQELVKNGGFEEKGKNWAGLETWGGGSVLEVVSEDSHSGSYSAKYTTMEGDNPHMTQPISGINGSYKYRLSFWYKGATTGNGWSVKFEMNGVNGYSELYTEAYQTAFDWTKVEYDFYPGEGVESIDLMPRTYTAGTNIYIDDISLKVIEGPDMLDMDTDWVFYYQEYEEGTLTVTVDDFYDGSAFTADVKMTDNGKEVYSDKALSFKDNKLVHKFSLKELKKKKEYKLIVTVKDGSGKEVETLEQFIYRIDRPTIMTKDCVFMMDGKVFEPVMADHFDIKDSEDALKAGINVLQWAPKNGGDKALTMAELDDIQKRGMKAAVVCYWDMYPAGHEINEERIQTFVKMIKDHPAVFCYMIMDEPFAYASNMGGVEGTEDILRNSYKIIRMIDDAHPVYCCDDKSEMYSTTAKYVDLLTTDPYPAKGDFSTHVGNKTLIAKEAVRGEKMILTTLQSFSWQGVTPSPEMLRTQQYQAFMGGTHAISYYPWVPDDPNLDEKLNQGRYWETMLDFNKYEKPIFFSYYARGEMETVNSYRGDDYWSDVFTDGTNYYAAVQLRKTHSKRIEVSLTNDKGETISPYYKMSVINGGKISDVKRSHNSFTADLEGYGAVLYKFEPSDQIDPRYESPYIDMKDHTWAHDAVARLDAANIIDLGDDYIYHPAEKITRGDFAKMLIRTIGAEADGVTADDNFADVDPDADYALEVAIGKKLGILLGTGDNMFNPEAEISRQDLMVICFRGMKLVKQPEVTNAVGIDAFSDKDMIADYAVESITAMVNLGIIKGNADGTINPLGNTTRAEAAVIMSRILDWK